MTLLRICNWVDCGQWRATRFKRSKAKKSSVTPTKPKRPNTLDDFF